MSQSSRLAPQVSGFIRTFVHCSLVCLLLMVSATASPAAVASGNPLSVKEVAELLQGGVPSARIAQIVADKGISFTLSEELERRFRDAGASQQLIDALRKASKAPPEAQPAAAGILKLQSKPGEAQVYLNDEPKGMTSTAGDLRLPGLAPGTYRLRLSLVGYRSWENSIDVAAGETKVIFAVLDAKPQPPSVTLAANQTSISAGQSVTLDWTSGNASQVDIEPEVGKVATTGTTTVSPRESTTYTITAIGEGGVNTATAHVNVTPAATEGVSTRLRAMRQEALAATTGGIPIPGARVTEVKFFESGYDAPVLGQRTYQQSFNHRTARYISWELNITCPAIASQVNFDIDATFYNPDGSIFAQQTLHASAQTGWTGPVFNLGRGWKEPGNWKRGNYRVVLSVNGSQVASNSFQVF